jgi:hypothetical protein
MPAIIADGTWLFSPMSDVVTLISAVMSAIATNVADVNTLRALLLHSEIDTACHANALETPLLLSSDVILADVELD